MKKGLVLKPKKVEKPTKTQTLKKKQIKGKKAKEVVIQQKFARYSSTEPKKSKIKATRSRTRPTHLKKSITPGTVLILLAGAFAGKRVVFLKQLTASGLLLVTGPFKLHGVPLRRVNQSYVIATSTKIDISNIKIPDEANDVLFNKKKVTKEAKKSKEPKEQTLLAKKPDEKVQTEKSEEVKKALEARKQLQKTVDEPLISAVTKVKYLTEYLSKSFTLKKGQYPHELIF